jgi:hypothetical protein
MPNNLPNSILSLVLVALAIGGAWPTQQWVLRRFRSERAGRIAWRTWRLLQFTLLLTALAMISWHMFGPEA